MKKIYSRALVASLLVTATLCASGQVVKICDQTDDNGVKEVIMPMSEINNYQSANGDVQLSYMGNPLPTTSKQRIQSGGMAEVTFEYNIDYTVFDIDKKMNSVNIIACNDEYYNADRNSLTMPVGVYDFCTEPLSMVNSHAKGYLIKEQVHITGDTTIVFDISASEIKNKYSFKSYLPNGDEFKWKIYNSSGEVIQPSNVRSSSFYMGMALKGHRPVSGVISFVQSQRESNKYDPLTIFTNDVSDRYQIIGYHMFVDTTFVNHVCKYESQLTNEDETVITNEVDNWVLYQEDFVPSLINNMSGEGYIKYGATGVFENNQQSGIMSTLAKTRTKDKTISVYVNTPKSTAVVGDGKYDVLTRVVFGDLYYKELGTIAGRQVLVTKDEIEYINNGIEVGEYYSTFNYDQEGSSEFKAYPGHPQFSFTDKQKALSYGSNAPINVIASENYYEDGDPYSYIICSYVGRYGEVRNTDLFALQSEVKFDGEIISSSFSTINNDIYKSISNNGIEGIFEAKFVNENFVVDDLAGLNETNIYYDGTKEDWTAPTLQMLQFRDTEGNVIDRFESGEEGILMFAGGDFTYNCYFDEDADGYIEWYTNQDIDVEVNYSPYLQNDWKELVVEDVRENFYLPSFGYFYQGSLKDVQGKGENGWFDLKVKLTDTSGNWQEQVISPAFCLKDHMATSIDEVKTVGTAREIQAIYSIDGKRLSGMQSGINIVRYTDGTASKVLVK